MLAAKPPKWGNKIPDSSDHASYFAFPIKVRGQVIGLLRFTAKATARGLAFFSDADEIALGRIVDDHIGPRLHDLLQHEAQRRFCNAALCQPIVKALTQTFLAVSDGGHSCRYSQVNFARAMRPLFPREGSAEQLYLFNHVPDEGSRFVHAAWAGSVARRLIHPARRGYELAGSLTGTALAQKRWVYIHDMARATQLKLIHPLLAETACALACPLDLGKRGRGAVVLHSTRHDIVPEVHGPLLEHLMGLTTQIVNCKC
jgi:hypothetical protein